MPVNLGIATVTFVHPNPGPGPTRVDLSGGPDERFTVLTNVPSAYPVGSSALIMDLDGTLIGFPVDFASPTTVQVDGRECGTVREIVSLPFKNAEQQAYIVVTSSGQEYVVPFIAGGVSEGSEVWFEIVGTHLGVLLDTTQG